VNFERIITSTVYAPTITTTTTPTVTPTTTITDPATTVTTSAYVYGTQTAYPVEYVAIESACPTTTATVPTSTMTDPTTTTPPSDPGDLPNTGSNVAPALLFGLLFIVGGATILVGAYRRQPTR
jgi:LPXTG-motif cell wall-anchored protein